MQLPRPGPRLKSFGAQSLLLEFSSLPQANLDGIYVSITSSDPTSWVGVLFVRQGPYAPAILRFQISFPPQYPSLPPLVTFATDIFHPLVTPLTTYTYTTGSTAGDTVSATDHERLPPGVFSLRHGFPQLFKSARRSAETSQNVDESLTTEPNGPGTPLEKLIDVRTKTRPLCVAEILKYIQSTFSDEAVLDSMPPEAAANPGAYHAWRTYRAEQIAAKAGSASTGTEANLLRGVPRKPGEWNWEGVWEERVKKGIRASLSEASLFAGGPDEIQFLPMDKEELAKAKQELEASFAASQMAAQ